MEYSYSGKAGDQARGLEAQAVEVKALADIKPGKKIGEAKKEASDDKMDASYKVAVEKCDALAGNAKTNCVAAAKAKFGKNCSPALSSKNGQPHTWRHHSGARTCSIFSNVESDVKFCTWSSYECFKSSTGDSGNHCSRCRPCNELFGCRFAHANSAGACGNRQ